MRRVTETINPDSVTRHERSFPVGVLTALQVVLFAPLAALLVFVALPAAFGIEWLCLFDGPETDAAVAYGQGFAIAGLASWVLLVVGTIIVHRRGYAKVASLLPSLWLGVLVGAAFIAAAAAGPQPCAGTDGFGF